MLAAAAFGAGTLRAELPSGFPEGWTLDVGDREAVRAWHAAIAAGVEGAEPGWTGDVAANQPGTLNPDFQRAQILRWNWYRALAGVTPRVALDTAWSSAAQQAALMMAANNRLSHTPDPSWRGYTTAGAEAARWSNLALLLHGPQAISGYMSDGLAGNEAVGHRRWMLFPNILRAGVGDIPGSATVPAANVLWLLDPAGLVGGGPMRDGFVAWPAPGHVPHDTVPDRWSFTLPGADFSGATLTLRRDGAVVPVRLEPVVAGFGDATLVWVPEGRDANAAYLPNWPAPAADVAYDVALANVRVRGVARSFAYRVTVFDAQRGPARPAAVAPAQVAVGVPLAAQPGVQIPWSSPDIRLALRLPLAARWGAEEGDPALVTRADGEVRAAEAAAAGLLGYRLLHVQPRDQVLELPRAVVPRATGALRFRSRLGFARSGEVARVEASLDEGGTWRTLWSQAGRDDGRAVESAFVERTVALGAFAGRRTRLRLVYAYTGGVYFNTAAANAGWAVDDITLEACDEAVDVGASPGALVSSRPGPADAWWRPMFLDVLQGEWALPAPVEVEAPAAPSAAFANASVRGVARSGTGVLILGLVVEGGARRVLVRAVGEGLAPFGVDGVLTRPVLEVFRGAERVAVATGSGFDAERAAERAVGAFPVASGGNDRVVVVDLAPGAYTVVVQPAAGVAAGVVLAEVYDIDGAAVPGGLGNVSVRGRVESGDGVLIPGFVLRGTEARVLARAVGPGLAAFDVAGWVARPRIRAFRGAEPLAAAGRWTDAERAAVLDLRSAGLRAGAFALVEGDADAALRVTLQPGPHSVVTWNEAGLPGVVLAELYLER